MPIGADLPAIRRELHRRPELSRREAATAELIAAYARRAGADEVVGGLGGHGVAAVLEGASIDGPTVLLRADLDALPIPDRSGAAYASEVAGVGHMCGHDGHMTIMLGALARLAARRAELAGRVICLFQPAEEIAHGARAVLEDPAFATLRPDYAFALHNLPGFPLGSLILRRGIFASASRGVKVYLHGETSHAGHPEDARSPAAAVAALIDDLQALPALTTPLERAALVTVIHAVLGEEAFGTTPGEAVVMATLRAHRDAEMERLCQAARRLAAGTASAWNLEHELEWVEVFPAVVNDDTCVGHLERVADELKLEIVRPAEPFPWSEDFGCLLNAFPGALFGLGAGVEHPQLHSSHYDFPDELLQPGVEIWTTLMEQLLTRR